MIISMSPIRKIPGMALIPIAGSYPYSEEFPSTKPNGGHPHERRSGIPRTSESSITRVQGLGQTKSP